MKISLVVPVKNEAATIEALLASIAAQTTPPDEVVIVDGGSVDGTPEMAERWAREHQDGVCLRVLRLPEATPGKGRNAGIAAAAHPWIALTDAGISLEPAWLERLTAVVKPDAAVQVVYGNYEPVVNSRFERCAALAYAAPKQERPGGRMRGPFIASSLLRREVWEAVGGFPDLRAAEDLIFMKRIEDDGYKVGWAPTATVWWQLQPTLRRTFRRFAVYSRHNVWAGWQRYWHYGVARQYLLGAPFLLLAFIHGWWWLAVPLAGATARVAKSIWLRREGQPWRSLLNPLQFFMVGVILLTLDLATFVGWGQALWRNRKDTGAPTRKASTLPI